MVNITYITDICNQKLKFMTYILKPPGIKLFPQELAN